MLPESLLSVANKVRDLTYFETFSIVENLIKTADQWIELDTGCLGTCS